MKASPCASSTKEGVDAKKDDDKDGSTIKQQPALEEDTEKLDQRSEPQSGAEFSKVF